MGLKIRNGWYYFYKRVPKYLKEYDSREFIRVSLKTKDKFEARKKALIYEEQYKKFWQSLIQKGKKANQSDYKKLSAIAMAYGYAYKDITEITDHTPIAEVVSRLDSVASNLGNKDTESALLGTANVSPIPLSSIIENYWENCADRFVSKSEHQIRKFKNPRELALKEFIQKIGDKDLKDVTRTDILEFRKWLMTEISKESIITDTANKKLSQIKDIIRTVSNIHEIPIEEEILFAKTRFKPTRNSRPSFEVKYVQEKLLPNLSGLNDDAKLLVYAMADTGAREAELIGLRAEDIFLNSEIPFIWIRPQEKRKLKTKHSERQIPLVGTSLYAFQKMPLGFNRYKEADSASTLINQYLTKNNLRPTPEHSLYSLRHTFKDRLIDAQAPEELIDQLMAHTNKKPKYGRGHLLELSHQWLQKIAFIPPENI